MIEPITEASVIPLAELMLHVAAGSLWMVLLLIQVSVKGLSTTNIRRLSMLSLFWHFLDIIWIFIFTIVYLTTFA